MLEDGKGVGQEGEVPSPDEVDQYVAPQVESLETDGGLSKESFNTDKIRKENLNQNFVDNGTIEERHGVVVASPDQAADCGIVSFGGGLTFGPNSLVADSNRGCSNAISSSNASSQVQAASNPLAGLQEIYSVHQYNLGSNSLHS